MKTEFKAHIEANFVELKKQPFLLAFSGGVDSVVLAHLCMQNQFDFTLAHCNFKLRGSESTADELFVQQLATEWHLKIVVTSFDTMGYVNTNKMSVEMAARELRYQWFAEVMKEKGFETVVTAHHANDNLETFLINLSRGTGLEGLNGIPAKTATLSRPLLPFSRAQIMAYAEDQKLHWREDSTNRETLYLRNKIRHEVVPKLMELHPTFQDNFQMTQAYLSDTTALLADYISLLKTKLFEQKAGVIRIPITELVKLKPLKSYVHALFHTYGFTAWNDIVGLVGGMSGKEVRSKTHRLVKDRAHILLEELKVADSGHYPIQENDTELVQPVHLRISEVDSISETNENTLYVPKSALKYPLGVRKWKKGDYFYPFGMRGKKKLSKYFKDEKIDIIAKQQQWLLCSGNEIVWVIGRRADNRFKITTATQQIVKFRWIK